MNIEDGLELFVGHLLNDIVPRVPSVVDDDVRYAPGVHGRRDEALSKPGFNDTAGATHGFSARGAQQFKCFLSRFFIQIVHHDPRAFAREFQCDAAADATTGS